MSSNLASAPDPHLVPAFPPRPCRRALRRLGRALPALAVRSPSHLWECCCDPWRFDMHGHRALCFTKSDWEVRFCCAVLQDADQFKRMWLRVMSARPSTRPDFSVPNVGSREYAFVTYHKTGTFVATQLIGYDELPGPFASVLLGASTRKHFDYDLRGQNSTIFNSSVEYTETFMRVSLQGRLVLIYNPLEHEIKQDVRFILSTGKIVHFIRRPSSIIISGYMYHLKGSKYEYWLHAANPPNCHHCDYEAWEKIFRPCDFGCTYLQRLEAEDLKQGLRLEVLRARWTIVKMLQNWNRWKDLANVLHISASEFLANLTSALGKVARFFEPRMPSHMLTRLLAASIESGLDPTGALKGCSSRRCKAEVEFALRHSSATANETLQKSAREMLQSIEEWRADIAPADAFYDALWSRAGR